MGWISEDGLHEGYVVPEFEDGERGSGTTGGGVADDQVIMRTEYLGEPGAITGTRYVTRPAAEVVGWRVMCDCRRSGGDLLPEDERWISDLLVRVPTRELADPRGGRIYAASNEVCYIADGDDLEEALRLVWHRGHAGVSEALSGVRTARQQELAATRELTEAVREARQAGASWEAIGQATGMAKQSAHGRWGQPAVS